MKKLIFTFLCIFLSANSLSAQVTWKPTAGPTSGSTNSLSVDSLGRIYTCTGGAGIYQSTDQGITWHGFNRGLRVLPVRWLESSTIANIASGTVAYVYALSHRFELARRVINKTVSETQWEYLDSVVRLYSPRDSMMHIFSQVPVNQMMTNRKGYLYLATASFGVVRSRNEGKDFDQVNLDRGSPTPDSFIVCMAIDPRNQDIYCIGSRSALRPDTLFRSTDEGSTWNAIGKALPNSTYINKMVIANDGSIILGYNVSEHDSLNAQVINGVTFGNRVYRSTDLGQTWNGVLQLPILREISINQLRVSPKTGNIYLNPHGPTYMSSNNGASWVLRNPEKRGEERFDLVVDSAENVYQCCIPDGIFKSSDSANTFVDVNQTLKVQHLDGGMCINSKGDVFVASQFNQYRSTDGGNTWLNLPNELDEGQVQILMTDQEDRYYYGLSRGMLRSLDNGLTFDTIIHQRGTNQNQIFYTGVSPKDELFASCAHDQFGNEPNPPGSWFGRSKDHGNTWTRINTSTLNGIISNEDVYCFGFSATDPRLDDTIYVATNTPKIYRSINDGINWEVVNNDGQGVKKFICHPDGSVFRLESGETGGVLRSVDGGRNWVKIFPDSNSTLFIPDYFGMTLDRTGRIVVSTSDVAPGGIDAGRIADHGIYRSDATFTKWENVTSGLIAPDYYTNVYINCSEVVQDKNTGVFYAGSRGASVFKTLPDMATFWNAVPIGHFSAPIAEPVNYPNPFTKSTQISFEVPNSGFIKISIYDMMGRLMQTLHSGYMDAGTHTLSYDASSMVSNGKYVVVLQSETATTSHWMTVVK